jgi:hypothetical protein
MCPMDTTPEAWEFYLNLLRKQSPEERMARVFQWSEVVRQFHLAGLRERYPNADEREIFLRAAKIKLGNDLFCKVYGDVLNAD